MRSEELTPRLNYIDVSKGIGILSVVIAHVYYRGLLNNVMYLYHMPLFFFISGYLFKPKNDQGKYFSDKIVQLIVPYVIYLIIVYSIQVIVQFSDVPVTRELEVRTIQNAILGGPYLGGFTAVFWFVPCLFMTLISINFLFKIYSPKSIKIAVVVMLCYITAYLISYFLPYLRFPYDVNVVLAIIPIFYLGFLAKSIDSPQILFIAIFLGILGIAMIAAGIKNYNDMKSGFYGIPIITTISSIAVVYLVIAFSKKIVFFSGSLAHLGKASLVVMYLHQPVQILCKMYITENVYIRIVIALTVSYLFFLVVRKHWLTRALFLGSLKDFNILSNKLSVSK